MTFSPLARASQVSAEQVRTFLRNCFERWGLPKAIRVDNGAPWGTSSDIPSVLHLWVLGLGIKVLLNRPHQSTDNGIVERDHGVLAQWVEPQRTTDINAFKRQLDWAIQMQRERYPVAKDQTRLALHPDLLTNPRYYQRATELQQWQLQPIFDTFATRCWIRRVDQNGRIGFFSNDYSVGRAYARSTVTVRLDPQTHEWVIETEQGQVLKRYPCQEICADDIHQLRLIKRANKKSYPSS